MEKEEKLKSYPKTEQFEVIDTIGVPHPYCITSKHVAYAADHCHGMLNEEAIRKAEKVKGAHCDVKNCNLSYNEHEQALLVACYKDIQKNEELHRYLLKIKDEAEKNGYAGFAFLDKR